MRHFKLLSVLLLTGIITACGGGTSAPSEYKVVVYPIEGDFDRGMDAGIVSSRDECAAKAMEMKATAYECQPN
tara:strand:- start:80 stop:298 length:219 start_codon:yes stop_codon:yes gene_type:complete